MAQLSPVSQPENSRTSLLDDFLKMSGIYRRNYRSFLDVGCGDGFLTEQRAVLFGVSLQKTVGVDVRTPSRRLPFEFVQCDFDEQNIPLKDGAFQIATCTQVLHHVRRAELLLKDIARLLDDGGLLIIRETLHESLLN